MLRSTAGDFRLAGDDPAIVASGRRLPIRTRKKDALRSQTLPLDIPASSWNWLEMPDIEKGPLARTRNEGDRLAA